MCYKYATIGYSLTNNSGWVDGTHAHRFQTALEWQQIMEYTLGFCARITALPDDHGLTLAYDESK